MEDFKFCEENFSQILSFHEEENYFQDFRKYSIFCMYLLPYWSLDCLLGEELFSTQHFFCTSTITATKSSFLQDELYALFEGDILSFWADMEEEDAYRESEKADSEKELKLDRGTVEKATKMQGRLSNGSEGKPLTFELVSQYFYMPIKQAAQELSVGLTVLKKRCRELGIPRWPHRKVKSLQTLIKNVQELGKGTGVEENKTRTAVEMLQQTKKLIEESPGVTLDAKTKVLRQACFKENFKRRRRMALDV